MSIIDTRRDQLGLDHLQDQVRRGAACFYCHKPLTSPCVHWMGSGFDLYCHPACVVELTIRLLRDVHEIECSTNTDITSRTTPELRQRLVAEESRG